MLKLYLLGPARLTYRDQDVAWRAPPMTLPLLARLALAGPGPLERAALARSLWPDHDPGEARANLRRHLQHLRAALPAGEWVHATPTHLHLAGARLWVDVAEFETLTGQDHTLNAGVDLYRGPLLQGQDEDEWLLPERERLRARYLVALGALVREHRAILDYTRAISHAERLLAEDPLREDVLRQLVTLHAEAGNRTAALARLDRFALHLDAELGVPPMPETLALRERLTHGEVIDPFPLAESGRTGRNAAPWHLPLVGRSDELRRLRDLWAAASRGRGPAAWLSGEAGVGKTRLARELALGAEAEGTLVLVGRTTSPETRPHQALADALGGALPLLLDVPGAAAWLPVLATLLPALRARVPGLPQVTALPAEQERERLAASVADALGALARTRPVLLGMEDLHWASEASLGLLAFLIRRAPPRTFILATSRDDLPPGHPLQGVRRRLREEGAAELLALRRLRPDDALRVAGHTLPPATAAMVAGRSEGLPLFLTELAHEALHSDTGQVPRSIQETVRLRLERLEPPPRTLVEIASVLGPAFPASSLQEISGWPEGEVLGTLDELIAARFLRETFGGHLAFVHGLVQECVYHGLDASARTRLHRRAGLKLAGGAAPAQAADLARHLDLGGLGAQAAPHYAQAARQAAAQGAPDDARQFLDRALIFTDDLRQRFDLLALREELGQRGADLPDWERDLDALSELAQTWGDLDARREALRRRVLLYRRTGDQHRERELIAELQALSAGAPLWEARAALFLSRWHYLRGETGAAAQGLAPARQTLGALGEPLERLAGLHLEALVEIRRGHLEAAEVLLAQALAHAEASGDGHHEAIAIDIGLMLTQENDDVVRTLGYARRHLELALLRFDRNGEATAEAFLGGAAIKQGRWPDAREHYTRAGELWGALGRTQGLIAVRLNLATLDVFTGAVEQGLAGMAAAHTLALETHDHMYTTACLIGAAWAYTRLGQHAQARELARQGADLTRSDTEARRHAEALTWLGVADLGLGAPRQAATRLDQAAQLLRADRRTSDLALALCHLVQAHLVQSDLPQARRAADELRTLDLARIWPVHHDLYHWTLGAAAQAHGQQAAAEHFGHALAAFRKTAEAIPEPERRAALLALPFSQQVIRMAERSAAP
ncbi:ATP-binding protein [Deinococcus planocerae]|uniref:ATP-binding protein n=1 Tax=Deinococcus planocerae TaxID=1737569 RepID=UPI000C7EDB87|nr:AAA family ATPase [Deinococcus planocerae]